MEATPGARITRLAPAKVNLALAVGAPRAGDGLHPICSWFVALDLADELRVERRSPGGEPESRYEIRWTKDAPRPTPIDWPLETDLCVRAHRLLEREAGRALPVLVALHKRVPVGGGLGGGSSDAAAALLALRALFGLVISDDRLRVLARTLGSDVPFFLADPLSPAIVEGVGESVERTPRPAGGPWLLLIFPSFGCPTGAVYRAFDGLGPGPMRADSVRAMARGAGRRGVEPGELFNDLAAAAELIAPGLAGIRERASRAIGLPVHITGSGSTLFAVCTGGRAQAEALGVRVRSALPDCPAMPTGLI